jgi:hypothetical protein
MHDGPLAECRCYSLILIPGFVNFGIITPDYNMTNYGRTWWGSRWLNALSHIDYANRLPRGRRYANKEAVRELDVAGRKIVAAVQGTRAKPYCLGHWKTLKPNNR